MRWLLRSLPLLLLTLPASAAVAAATNVAARQGTPTPPLSTVGIVTPSPPKPNYLDGPQMRTSHRWRRFPVRVYFAPDDAYSPERGRTVQAGFDEWTRATGGVLSYVIVDSAADADVRVHLLSVPHLADSPTTVGLTHTSSRGPWLDLARMDLAADASVTPELLTEVAAHEWGHALGINGHSDDPSDLMYGVTVRVIHQGAVSVEPPSHPRTPSLRDRNTVRKLYADRFATAH